MKRPRLILFAIFFYASMAAEAQSRYVLKVIGQVENEQTQRTLAKGDLIQPDSPLKFADYKAKVLVISREKGRELLTASVSRGKPSDQAFASFIAHAIAPPKSNRRLSSKSVVSSQKSQRQSSGQSAASKQTKTTAAIKNIVLLAVRSLRLDTALSAKYAAFLLHYTLEGKEVFKTLTPKAGQIMLSKSLLFSEASQLPKSLKTTLYGYDSTSKTMTSLTDLTLVMPAVEALKQEVELIAQHTDEEKIEEEILGYITSVYCCVDCIDCFAPEDVKLLWSRKSAR